MNKRNSAIFSTLVLTVFSAFLKAQIDFVPENNQKVNDYQVAVVLSEDAAGKKTNELSDDDWGDEKWGDEEWGDEEWAEPSPHKLKTVIDYSTGNMIGDSINSNERVLNELRASVDYSYSFDSFKFQTEVELLEDRVIAETDLSVYEANLTYSGWSYLDLKLGRQVITWGTGDLVFLNDLFSKSWISFFNGRSDKYLKPAIDAIRLSHYGNSVNWELAILPQFEADQLPNGERYSFYLPSNGIIQPQPILDFQSPNDDELSLRVFGRIDSLEWAVYAYDGFFKSPSKFLANQPAYAKMRSLGGSVRFPALSGLFNAETVYYQSEEDKVGTDPLIVNSQVRLLLGYETEIKRDMTLALQAYWERILDYQALVENSLPQQEINKQNRTMLTARLTHLAFGQRLTNSVMLFYSPSDEDHYLRASTRYKLTDQWQLSFGLNLFGGKRENAFFTQFKENSNWFMSIKYSF